MSNTKGKAYLRVKILAGTLAVLSDFAGMGFCLVSILTGMIWILTGMHACSVAFAGLTLVPLDVINHAGSFAGLIDLAGFAGLSMPLSVPG